MSRPSFKPTSILAVALVALVAIPATAEAQRRGPGRGPSRSVVVIGAGFGYPGPFFYDQWGPWGPYGPYGPGRYGPYRPYPLYFDDFSASLRFDVEPKDADVYVDGALAGQIDDFDGIFQSLRLRPGTHEIVVFRDGYRSARETVYVEPYQSRKLRFDLQKLGAGEAQEPRPQAPAIQEPEGRIPAPRMPPGRRVPERPEPETRREAPAQFGTLSLRVAPADAEVFVDGERWTGATTGDRLSIRLSAGRHRVEVRKQGLATYSEEVLIRAEATLSLNVSLR